MTTCDIGRHWSFSNMTVLHRLYNKAGCSAWLQQWPSQYWIESFKIIPCMLMDLWLQRSKMSTRRNQIPGFISSVQKPAGNTSAAPSIFIIQSMISSSRMTQDTTLWYRVVLQETMRKETWNHQTDSILNIFHWISSLNPRSGSLFTFPRRQSGASWEEECARRLRRRGRT